MPFRVNTIDPLAPEISPSLANHNCQGELLYSVLQRRLLSWTNRRCSARRLPAEPVRPSWSKAEQKADGQLSECVTRFPFLLFILTSFPLIFRCCNISFPSHCSFCTFPTQSAKHTTIPPTYNLSFPASNSTMSPAAVDSGSASAAGPLTVDAIPALRAKSAKIPLGVAPATHSDLFKSPVRPFSGFADGARN